MGELRVGWIGMLILILPLPFVISPREGYSVYISYDENELKIIINIHNVKYPISPPDRAGRE